MWAACVKDRATGGRDEEFINNCTIKSYVFTTVPYRLILYTTSYINTSACSLSSAISAYSTRSGIHVHPNYVEAVPARDRTQVAGVQTRPSNH
jgi:hypothetical protein